MDVICGIYIEIGVIFVDEYNEFWGMLFGFYLYILNIFSIFNVVLCFYEYVYIIYIFFDVMNVSCLYYG